jgi:hypothetical protein
MRLWRRLGAVRVDSGEGVLVAGGSSDELLQLRKKEMDLMRQQIWKKLKESHPGRCSSWGWKNGGNSAQFGEDRRSGMVRSSQGGKRSEERRQRLLCQKALGTARREERRRGGGLAACARGGRPTRGATEEGALTVGNGRVWQRRAAIGQCE